MNAILEEILSDYLDERLSPEECAELEQRLAREPELQAAYDSLRAVRDVLQRLPPVSPAGDWSERVLGRAKTLELTTETGEPVQRVQRASPGQSGPRRWRTATYLRFLSLGLIAGLLLIGFFWQRNSFVGQRLAEKELAPAAASSAAPSLRSPETTDSPVAALDLAMDSMESASLAEEAVSQDAPASPRARRPAPAAQAAAGMREVGSSAGQGEATRSALIQPERLQAETVSIRVDLPKNLFHVVLANHDISPQIADPQSANQLRAGRASASRDPRVAAGEAGHQEVYVVEATQSQLNAALQELATQGTVEVLDELAVRKSQESADKLIESKALRRETPAAGRRVRRETEPKKSLARSGDKTSAKVRRPAGKTPPRYRILFLLTPRSTGKSENR
ncbi:MAG: hypothetical protein VX346_10245 [Planctomycetota bacterium]|nr:hypothetical protein [Planctomycetota bacterium]